MLHVRLSTSGILLAAAIACQAQVTFTEFQLPPAASGYPTNPSRIAVGRDNNLWITEPGRIGRITTSGVIAEFPITTTGNSPLGITQGPDGNMWFTEQFGSLIGKITPTGVVTEFAAHPAGGGDISAGPDGNLYFTETQNIGKMTPAGIVLWDTPSQIPTIYSSPDHICVGPDGNLWFTEGTFGGVGILTPAGGVTKISPSLFSNPRAIIAGTDGNLWFTDAYAVGTITPSGSVTRYGYPPNLSAYELTIGPDGNIWFSGGIYEGTGIGRITPKPTGGLKFDFFLAPTNPVVETISMGSLPGPMAICGSPNTPLAKSAGLAYPARELPTSHPPTPMALMGQVRCSQLQ